MAGLGAANFAFGSFIEWTTLHETLCALWFAIWQGAAGEMVDGTLNRSRPPPLMMKCRPCSWTATLIFFIHDSGRFKTKHWIWEKFLFYFTEWPNYETSIFQPLSNWLALEQKFRNCGIQAKLDWTLEGRETNPHQPPCCHVHLWINRESPSVHITP